MTTIVIVALCLAYAVFSIGIWVLLSFAGDRWWPATFLLFSPRWVWGVPVLVLLPLALVFRRRWAIAVAASAVVVLFGPMRFRVPVRIGWGHGTRNQTVRLVTANLHNREADAQVVDDFVARTHPDVIVLQAYSGIHLKCLHEPDWHVRGLGGMIVASRWPLNYHNWFKLSDPPLSDLEARFHVSVHGEIMCSEVDDPAGVFYVVNLHLSSPHQPLGLFRKDRDASAALLESNSERRRIESADIARQVRQIGGPFILAGDFNTPDDSPIFRESWTDFSDAFDTAGFGFGTSYAKHRTWLRIDHILYPDGWRCRTCFTSGDVGSGHRAVFAELVR